MCEVLHVGEQCHLRPHYALSPDLPPGPSLEPHTGCITGIPEAHTPRTKYTLTASFKFEVVQGTAAQPTSLPDATSIQTSTEPPVTPADPCDPSPSEDTTAEDTTDAGSCPVPPWWHKDPDQPTAAAVPLEEAVQGLVAEAVEEECGHRLTQAQLDALVCVFFRGKTSSNLISYFHTNLISYLSTDLISYFNTNLISYFNTHLISSSVTHLTSSHIAKPDPHIPDFDPRRSV